MPGPPGAGPITAKLEKVSLASPVKVKKVSNGPPPGGKKADLGDGPPPAGRNKFIPKGAVSIFGPNKGKTFSHDLKQNINLFKNRSPFRRDAKQIIKPAAYKPFKKSENEEKQQELIKLAEDYRKVELKSSEIKQRAPGEAKQWSNEDRKAVLALLQELKLFVMAAGGQLSV